MDHRFGKESAHTDVCERADRCARRFTHRGVVMSAASLSLLCAACSIQPSYRTNESLYCERHPSSPICTGVQVHWPGQPNVHIANDPVAGGPFIRCEQDVGGNTPPLTVHAQVINSPFPSWLRVAGASQAPAFWSRVDVTYMEGHQPPQQTKTYFVNSSWPYAGASTSGAVPNGLLPPDTRADLYGTFDSKAGNPARDASPHENIAFADAPFTVHVQTNVPNPTDPSAAVPDIGHSEATVTCSP